MTRSVCTFGRNPSAIFQIVMDVTAPLSIGPTEMTFLILLVIAIFLGAAYSKRLRICIDYLVGHGIG